MIESWEQARSISTLYQYISWVCFLPQRQANRKSREIGGCFSCRPPSSSSVLVVDLNGKVEFKHPVIVRQVTGKAGKHVVCTPAQLLIIGVKPLQPTTQLEAGRIYLMLPLSTHHVSPHDLASVVKKLTAAAAKSRSPCPGNAREEERVSHVVKRPWKPVLDPITKLSDEPL